MGDDLKFKTVKLSELKPADYNPRKISDKALTGLKASLNRYGVVEPIIVNERTGNIVGGHQRLKALLEMGKTETSVVCVDLPEIEEKALNIALNNKAIMGEYTDDVAALIEEIEAELPGLGKDLLFDDIDAVIKSVLKEGRTDPDDVPDVPEPISKPGDLWLLGEHRLLCGDSTKAEDMARLMDGKKADMVFTSPPYNAGNNALGGNKNLKKQKYINDSDNKTESEYLGLLQESLDCSMAHSSYQFFNIQMLSGNKIAVIKFLNDNASHFADVSIWHKGGGQPAMCESVMNSRFEFVFIFSDMENPTRQIKTNKFRGKSNVFELNPSGKNKNSDIHAAVFPVEFAIYYIEIGCSKNGIVVDVFCGSGSTLIACEQTGRICYGMELDPHYCDVIVKRWEDFTGKKAVLADA